MVNGDIDNGAPENDDDKLPLVDNTRKRGDDDGKKDKKKEVTFCTWLWQKPWNKLPFMYMLIGIVAVPGLAVFHFMDADTSFIICGGYIVLNIFAMRYFYTLIGLKAQVDTFGNLNQRFSSEHGKISHEVDKFQRANESLKDSQNRIRQANLKNRENLNQFAQLQETMKAMNLHTIDELKGITNKANRIGDKWQEQLIEHERDMLHTVFDRYEEASGKSGMTIKEFEEFSKQLPESYQKRFARLGTFEKISHDGKHLNFSDFDAALDLFAEMDALDCDIVFTIEKTNNKPLPNTILDKEVSGISTLEVEEDEEIPDIGMMKRWKTRRKKYDNVKRKIVVHSRTFRSKQAKEFTSVLGLADNESDDAKSEESDQELHDRSASAGSDIDWGRNAAGLGRTHTRDLIDAGKQESERKGLLDKYEDK